MKPRAIAFVLVAACIGEVSLRAAGDAAAPASSASVALPDQSVFTTGDNAATAYEKIRQAWPGGGGIALSFNLQYACRDFCARFPEDLRYVEIRRVAVSNWALDGNRLGQLKEWDPTDAVRDPKLDVEQRADIAMLIANGRAIQDIRRTRSSFADAQFDAVVAALPPHRTTKAARDTLIRAALMVAPEKAVTKLREFYPEDPDALACARLLESIGQPCEFQFTALDGQKVDSRDYLGKVVVLDFWSKGCGPCIALMPELKKMAERLGPEGFAVIGINMDDKRADAEEIINKFSLSWPEHFDGGGWKNALAQRFLVTSLPRTAVIDRAGKLRFMAAGPTYPDSAKRIAALLAEAPPAR